MTGPLGPPRPAVAHAMTAPLATDTAAPRRDDVRMRAPLATNDLYGESGWVDQLLMELAADRALRHLRAGRREARTRPGMPFVDAQLLASFEDDAGWTCVADLGDVLARVECRGRSVLVTTAAATRPSAAAAVTTLLGELAPDPAPERATVPVAFWSSGERGGRCTRRDVDGLSWAAVEHGYAASTRRALGELVAARAPGAGRLLLWHGAPGTGKTTALRALADAWRSWCRIHVVTDPDVLLAGGRAAYLTDVAMGEDDIDDGEPEDRDRGHHDARWRLLVLEDAGELIGQDAPDRTGQAVSRLLNLSDGLLGQGLRTLVLITTNESVGALHPAIRRPGRCWATVAFEPLSSEEAGAWLAAQGSDARVAGPATLAELHGVLAGEAPPRARPFGFVAE
jgi:hypothetical protein